MVVVGAARAPRRYAAAFSPEHLLPSEVQYIPYTHAVAEAHRRRRRGPLINVGLAVVWGAAITYELVGGTARQPVVLGLVVLSLVGFAVWNLARLVAMRRGDPSGAVWRYGLFLWPEALVVLPADGPVVIVAVDAIESVGHSRSRGGDEHSAERVVVVRATDDGGAPVNVVIDDLGAMPAPHLARTIDAWRT
jgi:hypothetical protein